MGTGKPLGLQSTPAAHPTSHTRPSHTLPPYTHPAHTRPSRALPPHAHPLRTPLPHSRPSLAQGGCDAGAQSIPWAGAEVSSPAPEHLSRWLEAELGGCRKSPSSPDIRDTHIPGRNRQDKVRGSCRATEKAILRLTGPRPPCSVPAAAGAAVRLLLPVAHGDPQQHSKEGAGALQAHGSPVPTNIPQPNPGYNGMLPVLKFPLGTRDGGYV